MFGKVNGEVFGEMFGKVSVRNNEKVNGKMFGEVSVRNNEKVKIENKMGRKCGVKFQNTIQFFKLDRVIYFMEVNLNIE